MKKQMNNKGFSLVELIVVIAIMGILAVTITPKLTQYIDKARQSNDREIPNSVFTAVRLGLLDDNVYNDVVATDADASAEYDWVTGVDILSTFYGTSANGVYTKLGTADIPKVDLLASEILQILGDKVQFQSQLAKNADTPGAVILVKLVEADKTFSVEFTYNGTTAGKYTMKSVN